MPNSGVLPWAEAAFRKQREAAGDHECDLEFADRLFDACGFDFHSAAAAQEDLFRRMRLVCMSVCCLNH